MAVGPCCLTSKITYLYAPWFGLVSYCTVNLDPSNSYLDGKLVSLELSSLSNLHLIIDLLITTISFCFSFGKANIKVKLLEILKC